MSSVVSCWSLVDSSAAGAASSIADSDRPPVGANVCERLDISELCSNICFFSSAMLSSKTHSIRDDVLLADELGGWPDQAP